MDMDLRAKVAIVTGGTSGIGRDAAVLFAKTGAKVAVAGRREAEGNETIDLIRAAGGDGAHHARRTGRSGRGLFPQHAALRDGR